METNPSKLLYYQKIVLILLSVTIIGLLTFYSIWISGKKESVTGRNGLEIIEQNKRVEVNLIGSSREKSSVSVAAPNEVTYVQIWAYHCAPCLTEIPAILTWEELKSINIAFLNVDDTNDLKKQAQDWLAEVNIVELPFYFMESGFPFDDSKALPRHLIIDKKGRIAADFTGVILQHRERWLKHLLAVDQEQ